MPQIPEFKNKPEPEKKSEKPKPEEMKQEKKQLASIPDFKGKPKEEVSKPLPIPEFKGRSKQEDLKNANVQHKSKVPKILLPDIDSPQSSDRFEESHDKEAIDDVKKRLQNYGNYIDEMEEDISSKKFEFENYGNSDEEYEEEGESGEFYADLSEDQSMHSEYLDDYDLVEDAEIVQSEDEEEEGSSNS